MTYKTTKAIRDLQDDEFCYYAGAIYPREGLEVSEERLAELVEKGHIVAVDEKTTEPVLEEAEGENGTLEDAKELSAKELKAKLDELGIEYKSRASKAELSALLDEAEGE